MHHIHIQKYMQLDELGRYTNEFSSLLHPAPPPTQHASPTTTRQDHPTPHEPPSYSSRQQPKPQLQSRPQQPPPATQQPPRELLVEGTVEDLGPILAGLSELSKRAKASAQAKLSLLSPHPPGRLQGDVERLQGFKSQLHQLQDTLLRSAKSEH